MVLIVATAISGPLGEIFTVRTVLNVVVADGGESIFARNVGLEHYRIPGLNDARRYLHLTCERGRTAGVAFKLSPPKKRWRF